MFYFLWYVIFLKFSCFSYFGCFWHPKIRLRASWWPVVFWFFEFLNCLSSSWEIWNMDLEKFWNLKLRNLDFWIFFPAKKVLRKTCVRVLLQSPHSGCQTIPYWCNLAWSWGNSSFYSHTWVIKNLSMILFLFDLDYSEFRNNMKNELKLSGVFSLYEVICRGQSGLKNMSKSFMKIILQRCAKVMKFHECFWLIHMM